MSTLADLYRAIKNARKKPRGIAVSTDIWSGLKKAGVIEMKTGFGLGLFRAGDKFPVFQGDIVVIVNPALDTETRKFLLTEDQDEVRTGAAERRRIADRRQKARRKAAAAREERRS